MVNHRNECSARGCSVEWYSYDPEDYCQDHEPDPDPFEGYVPKKRGPGRSYSRNHSGVWEAIRKKALDRDEWACVACGMTDEEHRNRTDVFPREGGIHVHHITPVDEFDDPEDAHSLENLVSLCGPCHKQAERGLIDVP